MDTRRTPEWILAAHLANQFSSLDRYLGATATTMTGLPSPEEAEALAMPTDDSLGLTMIRAERQFNQLAVKHAQKNRSAAVSLGRFTERRKTLSWWRRASTSN